MNTKIRGLLPFVLFLTVGTTLQVVFDVWVHILMGELAQTMSRPDWLLAFFRLFFICMAACAVMYRLYSRWAVWLPVAALAGFLIDVTTVAPPDAFWGVMPNPGIMSFYVSTSGLTRMIVDKAMKDRTPRWAYVLVVAALLFLNFGLMLGPRA